MGLLILLSKQRQIVISFILLSQFFIDTMIVVVSAIKALRDVTLEGRKVEIKSIISGDYNTNTSIFISGVNEQTTDDDLKQDFADFGLIVSSMVPSPSLSSLNPTLLFRSLRSLKEMAR